MHLRRPGRALTLLVAATACAFFAPPADALDNRPTSVKFATFNASLNRNFEGQLVADLSTPDNVQAKTVAEIIQRTRPDVLLINEFDFVDGNVRGRPLPRELPRRKPERRAADRLPVRLSSRRPNTGIPSGFDFNNNGVVGGPDDAFGFGFFPGQFGMAVFSKYPIDVDASARSRTSSGRTCPARSYPTTPRRRAGRLVLAGRARRVPAVVEEPLGRADRDRRQTVHFLVCHPTPPVFDGPEDRNGRRNHDEIRFWADYIAPRGSGYIYDDDGKTGDLHPAEQFVIAGDQNSDPLDGDSIPGAIQQLLESPRVQHEDHTVQ